MCGRKENLESWSGTSRWTTLQQASWDSHSHSDSLLLLTCVPYHSLSISVRHWFICKWIPSLALHSSSHALFPSLKLVRRTPATNLRLRLGDHNLRGQTEKFTHEEYGVKRKIVNEKYNPATYQNDIALLELSQEVTYKQHIIPVCLPERHENTTGRMATVTGWGRTQYGVPTSPGFLQKVDVEVLNSTTCQTWMNSVGRKEKIYPNMMCAGYKSGGKDSCQGDSGSPLTYKNDGKSTLIGLVSWGVGCARPNLPGVYTKISEFVDWINIHVKEPSWETRCLSTFSQVLGLEPWKRKTHDMIDETWLWGETSQYSEAHIRTIMTWQDPRD